MNGETYTCPSCKTTNSARSAFCTKCNRLLLTPDRKTPAPAHKVIFRNSRWFAPMSIGEATGVGIGFSVLGLGAIFMIAQCSANQQPTQTEIAAQSSVGGSATETKSDAAADAYTAGKMNLMATLKDAGSAKFRNMFVSRIPGGNLVLCGEVNSKNSFGGYIGFSRFVAHPNPNIPPLIEGNSIGENDEESEKIFRVAYKEFCRNSEYKF